MGKARKIASTANDQSEEEKRSHGQAQKEQRTVHFTALMDIRSCLDQVLVVCSLIDAE